MRKDFKEFALRGNVIDLAIGIIIGSAFTTIVQSLVNDIIMPPIGLVLGNVEFSDFFLLLQPGDPAGPYRTLGDAQAAGAVTINYGLFINNIVVFLIVAVATFFMVRGMNRLYAETQRGKLDEKEKAPTTKACDYCKEMIPIEAVRCPHCTSHLEAAAT